jgi:hypothetical protein
VRAGLAVWLHAREQLAWSDLHVRNWLCPIVCVHAGLLATQAGSIGRLVGNFSISVFGGMVVSIVAVANLMYLSFASVAIMCAVLFTLSYSKLKAK